MNIEQRVIGWGGLVVAIIGVIVAVVADFGGGAREDVDTSSSIQRPPPDPVSVGPNEAQSITIGQTLRFLDDEATVTFHGLGQYRYLTLDFTVEGATVRLTLREGQSTQRGRYGIHVDRLFPDGERAMIRVYRFP